MREQISTLKKTTTKNVQVGHEWSTFSLNSLKRGNSHNLISLCQHFPLNSISPYSVHELSAAAEDKSGFRSIVGTQ